MNNPQAPVRGLGKGMLIISWLIVLAGLTVFFGAWEEEQYNPNTSPEGFDDGRVRQAVLKRNRYNHYVVNGAINGTPVTFMLDTGATNVAIPEPLARELRLKPGAKHRVITANGTVEVRATVIKHLELGPIQLENVSASINPGMQGKEILLGMSALKQLEFVQSGDELTLRQYH